MFSLEYIRAMNDKATVVARGEDLEPYIASKDGDIGVRACPHLGDYTPCLLYTSPSPRDRTRSRMPSSA